MPFQASKLNLKWSSNDQINIISFVTTNAFIDVYGIAKDLNGIGITHRRNMYHPTFLT